jgi:hypothetical protein
MAAGLYLELERRVHKREFMREEEEQQHHITFSGCKGHLQRTGITVIVLLVIHAGRFVGLDITLAFVPACFTTTI